MTLTRTASDGGDCGGALGRFLGQFNRLDHLGHLHQLVSLGRQRAHVAILGDPRFFDAALGGDARALDFFGGSDLGFLEGLAFGDLQALQMSLALEPYLVERSLLGDPLRFGELVLDDLGAAFLGLAP